MWTNPTAHTVVRILLVLFLISDAASAALIGVDMGSGRGTPANWNQYTLADSGRAITGLIDEDGRATTATLRVETPTASLAFTPAPGVIPAHPNPLDSLCCDFLYGGPKPMIITWEGLLPNATYDYWLVTSSSASDTITVTGSTVDVFHSPVVRATSQNINGSPGSSASIFDSYARQVVSSSSGTITLSYASTGTPVPSAVAVRAVPEATTAMLLGLGLVGRVAKCRLGRPASGQRESAPWRPSRGTLSGRRRAERAGSSWGASGSHSRNLLV